MAARREAKAARAVLSDAERNLQKIREAHFAAEKSEPAWLLEATALVASFQQEEAPMSPSSSAATSPYVHVRRSHDELVQSFESTVISSHHGQVEATEGAALGAAEATEAELQRLHEELAAAKTALDRASIPASPASGMEAWVTSLAATTVIALALRQLRGALP